MIITIKEKKHNDSLRFILHHLLSIRVLIFISYYMQQIGIGQRLRKSMTAFHQFTPSMTSGRNAHVTLLISSYQPN